MAFKVENVDITKIKIENNKLTYETCPPLFVVEKLDCLFSTKYGCSLTCDLNKNENLKQICMQIDTLMKNNFENYTSFIKNRDPYLNIQFKIKNGILVFNENDKNVDFNTTLFTTKKTYTILFLPYIYNFNGKNGIGISIKHIKINEKPQQSFLLDKYYF